MFGDTFDVIKSSKPNESEEAKSEEENKDMINLVHLSCPHSTSEQVKQSSGTPFFFSGRHCPMGIPLGKQRWCRSARPTHDRRDVKVAGLWIFRQRRFRQKNWSRIQLCRWKENRLWFVHLKRADSIWLGMLNKVLPQPFNSFVFKSSKIRLLIVHSRWFLANGKSLKTPSPVFPIYKYVTANIEQTNSHVGLFETNWHKNYWTSASNLRLLGPCRRFKHQVS